jgi:hypothetical protein
LQDRTHRKEWASATKEASFQAPSTAHHKRTRQADISKQAPCRCWCYRQCSVYSTAWLEGASSETFIHDTDVRQGKYVFHGNV